MPAHRVADLAMLDCRCLIGPRVIEKINILQATLLAMHRAAAKLQPQADFYLVDGPQLPKVIP